MAALPRVTVDEAKLAELTAAEGAFCAMCQDDVAIGDVITELPECGHLFHIGK